MWRAKRRLALFDKGWKRGMPTVVDIKEEEEKEIQRSIKIKMKIERVKKNFKHFS